MAVGVKVFCGRGGSGGRGGDQQTPFTIWTFGLAPSVSLPPPPATSPPHFIGDSSALSALELLGLTSYNPNIHKKTKKGENEFEK